MNVEHKFFVTANRRTVGCVRFLYEEEEKDRYKSIWFDFNPCFTNVLFVNFDVTVFHCRGLAPCFGVPNICCISASGVSRAFDLLKFLNVWDILPSLAAKV